MKTKTERFNEIAKGKNIIKCDNQAIYEMIARGNVAEIKAQFNSIFNDYQVSTHSGTLITNFIAEALLEMIAKESNDFTKDIASKILEIEREPSEKQAWCLAYQIKNNQNVYLKAVLQEWDESTKNQRPDDILTAEDVELNRIGYELFIDNL